MSSWPFSVAARRVVADAPRQRSERPDVHDVGSVQAYQVDSVTAQKNQERVIELYGCCWHLPQACNEYAVIRKPTEFHG